jgi:hypothetical protein
MIYNSIAKYIILLAYLYKQCFENGIVKYIYVYIPYSILQEGKNRLYENNLGAFLLKYKGDIYDVQTRYPKRTGKELLETSE